MPQQGYYPIGARTLAGTDTVTGVVTGVTCDIPLTTLANFVSTAITPTAFGVLMLAWFNSLPTTLPGSAGVLWNNGGTLAQS